MERWDKRETEKYGRSRSGRAEMGNGNGHYVSDILVSDILNTCKLLACVN